MGEVREGVMCAGSDRTMSRMRKAQMRACTPRAGRRNARDGPMRSLFLLRRKRCRKHIAVGCVQRGVLNDLDQGLVGLSWEYHILFPQQLTEILQTNADFAMTEQIVDTLADLRMDLVLNLAEKTLRPGSDRQHHHLYAPTPNAPSSLDFVRTPPGDAASPAKSMKSAAFPFIISVVPGSTVNVAVLSCYFLRREDCPFPTDTQAPRSTEIS